MSDKVLFYEGKYYMFSNFSAFQVFLGGRWYPTAEHAYQATKFADVRTKLDIQDARSAHDAKKRARSLEAHKKPNWKEIKLQVMEDILRAKLEQHEIVRRRLLETGDREIVEDSPTDSFWGRGPDWKGENNLGKLWMKLRAELAQAT